ncbi:hypothetical protein BGZ73_005022 [Actinomortierella ambigua]|nr:hypothetical protein BGZ73_005022 [Actinomortierella ambigua]
MSLDALRQQHLLETQNQAVAQRQEQEQLLQQQQIQLREQEELFRAKHEHDAPHDQHQAWQQFQQHVQHVVTQQQQELLRQQYEAQMALRERQWRDEQQAMSQQMQLQLQQQPQSNFASLSFGTASQPHHQHQHQHQQHQQHNHNHHNHNHNHNHYQQHQQHQHQHHHHGQQQHSQPAFAAQYQNSPTTPQPQSQFQPQQHVHLTGTPSGTPAGNHAGSAATGGSYFFPNNSNSDSDTDMDIDDEAQVASIATSIQQLRQSSQGGDTPSMPAGWDADIFSGSQRKQKQQSSAASATIAAAQNQMDQREDFDAEDAPPRAVVVLDTNVLISHLNFVKDLIDSYGSIQGRRRIWKEKGVGIPRITFKLPWVVVQELDNLKSSYRQRGSEVDLAGKARRAIIYIQEQLAKDEQMRGLWGQKLGECVDAKTTKNDDAILDCCRYYKTLYPDIHQTRISLLSNDRNLGVKAMIHEIGHISFQNSGFVADKVVDLLLHGKAQDLTGGEKDATLTNSSASAKATASSSSTSSSLQRKHASDRTSNDLMDDLHVPDDPTRMASLNPDGMTFEQMTDYVGQIGQHKRSKSGASARRRSKSNRSSSYRLEVNDQELERLKMEGKPVTKPPPGMQANLFYLTCQVVGTVRQFLELAVVDHLAAFYGTRWRSSRSVSEAAERHLDSMADFVKRWERVEMFGLGKIYRKDVDQFLEDVDVILAGLLVKPELSPATADERAEKAAAMAGKPANGVVELSAHQMDDAMDEGDPCSVLLTHEDQEQLYSPKLRIRLVGEWKNRCKAMPM